MKRLRPLPLLFAFVFPGLCLADESQRPKARLSSVLEKSYQLRSEGKLSAAALGLEEVFSRLKADSAHRRTIAFELAQLYLVMKRPKRAIAIYRKLKELRHEVAALLSMEGEANHREALVVARAASYRLGEAQALAKLGKQEEALALLAKEAPLAGERGKLLLQLKRYAEAAKAFEAVNDYFGQAKATWFLDRDQAKRLFEDAMSAFELTYQELRPGLVAAKKRLEGATGVEKTRQRIFYAQCLGRRAQLFRDWSESAARAGDRKLALERAEAALKTLQAQKTFLTNRGRDRFGVQAAEVLGVDASIAEAEQELEQRRALPR